MKYKVTLNGKTYEVEVEQGEAILVDEYEAYAPAAPANPAPVVQQAAAAAPVNAPASPANPAASGTANPGSGLVIEAPMPGTVLSVKVSVGATVKKGDVLLILEAMKMENEIVAPRDGTVAQVVTTQGASVETGAALVVLA